MAVVLPAGTSKREPLTQSTKSQLPYISTADCRTPPMPEGEVNSLGELTITGGVTPWPTASPEMQKLNRSSANTNAKPTYRRGAVNDVVAIAFLQKELLTEPRKFLFSLAG